MRTKLRLDPEGLAVESFEAAEAPQRPGTVFGEECTCPTNCTCPGCPTCDETCPATCDFSMCYDTCWETCGQSCPPGCIDIQWE
jgi:hypothetical protein